MSQETQTAPKIDPAAIENALPQDFYQVFVLEATKGPNKKGNPMITLKLEIRNSPRVPVKDKDGNLIDMDPNGLQVFDYITLVPQAMKFVNQKRRALGLTDITEAELVTDDPGQYLNKVGYAILKGEKEPRLNAAGQPIMNPHTNQPMTVNTRRLVEWILP